MFRSLFLAAFAVVVAASMPGQASAQQSSAGYSCEQLPEIKKAAARYTAATKDRDRVKWNVDQAERLCKEGKAQDAKGYLDLAHSLVLKDHKH